MPELHTDLFSRHASPLESLCFVAVDEGGEDGMSDEICRRCDRKQNCCVPPDLSYERKGAGEVRTAKIILLVDGMGESKEKKNSTRNTPNVIIIPSSP